MRIAMPLWLCIVTWSASAVAQPDQPVAESPVAIGLILDGAVGPPISAYIAREVEAAQAHGAEFILLRMDTPGGLETSMREIVSTLLAAEIPVVVYVAPRGARAASAGTFILYAAHVAVMAPGTNVGAATPVQLGSPAPEAEEEAPPAAAEAKAVEDAVAFIRSLAELRGRNAEWAEAAVREAASLSAEGALQEDVIDFIAANEAVVLQELHGRTVQIDDASVVLNTRDVWLEWVEPDWRTELLSVLTNPNVAFLLMLLGVYGLIFELANPGAIFPGIIGATCLLMGLYALHVLPLNYLGLGLLLLGVALMTAEAFAPSFGVLGIGGIITFAIGATILLDTRAPGFELSPWVVIGATLATASFLIFIIRYVFRAHRKPVTTGRESLVGRSAEVLSWGANQGVVLVGGERWIAESSVPLQVGDMVTVRDMQGLHLFVEPRRTTTSEHEIGRHP